MRRFLPLLAVLLAAGCGHTASPPTGFPAPAPKATPGLPPESAITPDGARPAPSGPPVGLVPGVPGIPTINTAGLHLIEQFEGYSRCAYWDPYGRVYTAGYGQTHGVYAGFCFRDQAAAQSNLASSVRTGYEWAVRAIGFPFNQNEVNALDSFAYNLGSGIFLGALRSDLARGQMYAASRIMLQYDHAGGVVLPGLRTRRVLEVQLLLTPVKSKPTRAQQHHELVGLYKSRRALRGVIREHRCPAYRVAGPKCRTWRSHGAQTNRRIRALHAQHIY